MRIKLILLLLPLLVLSASCSRKQAPAAVHTPLLKPEREQVWQLVAIQGRTLEHAKKAPSLIFNPDAKTATGTAFCNEYTFLYALQHPSQLPDGDHYELHLSFWGSGSTECPEGEMSAERRYLALLGKATSLRLTASTLTIYQKNHELLHFELQ